MILLLRSGVVVALVLALVTGTARAQPDYLDLPAVNASGEHAGGLHPALPLDRAALENALDAARAKQIPPARYATLLWQYWLVRACDDAGVALRSWDPGRGMASNKDNVFAAYTFYGTLFRDHPDLHWAGLAGLVAPGLAAGFLDVGELAALGLPIADLRWFEAKLLAMQKHIFLDMTVAHVAFVHGGRPAVDEMRAAGLVDVSPEDALQQLVSRELNQVIAEQWNEMRAHNAPVGELFTYALTATGAVSVPGVRTPAQFAPLVASPLPAFNIADQRARWRYVTGELLPAYQRLRRDDVLAVLARPMADRVAEQRLVARAVDLGTLFP